MTRTVPIFFASMIWALAACQPSAPPRNPPAPGLAYTPLAAPEGATQGSCWGMDETPAVVETVTEQRRLDPGKDDEAGSATYITRTSQNIVEPRRVLHFETPCMSDLTPEFVSSLQRALRVRGVHGGPVTGRLDAKTRLAIRRYQRNTGGPDSAILALRTARELGLLPYPRDD